MCHAMLLDIPHNLTVLWSSQSVIPQSTVPAAASSFHDVMWHAALYPINPSETNF